MIKKIVLCADDYAQNFATSHGILELVEKKRLSAVSCLTTSKHWAVLAKPLLPYAEDVDVGLHFNLTEGEPLTSVPSLAPRNQFLSLSQLLIAAYTRQLHSRQVEQEFHAQLDGFVREMGQLPRFVDGHQHIHQLPVIREALVAVYQARLRHAPSYLRCVRTGPQFFNVFSDVAYFKKQTIHLLAGGTAFEKILKKSSIPHNSSFSGIYYFSQARHYAQLFPKFLSTIENFGLIMCHPGKGGENFDDSDALACSRKYELDYFLSEKFKKDCEHANVAIDRFHM